MSYCRSGRGPRARSRRGSFVTTYTYDARGRPTAARERPGAVTYTAYAFDTLGRLTSAADLPAAPEAVATYQYDGTGGPAREGQAPGGVTHTAYDGLGRRIDSAPTLAAPGSHASPDAD